MTDKFEYESHLDILRRAERERGRAVAAFFRRLFAGRAGTKDEYAADPNIVAAE